ncbi:P-loop_containing nucleoside triphosphate hydrolase [Hexamita inflata]|uniref:P-loop containing nucleoside triphosphate hydrolase n=1 Tax=Hexamita inflata TaxID=28002 RepID=A0AA86PUC5_9EUKA|nr:P-loop containing nucleoside triphosphate hydrolase [Hexamita inflata]CAI9963613.1 P-loop containing nucleoside triphosphate hydrolase [Hexamita inflata]
MNTPNLKIKVIGPQMSGKTTLINKLCYNTCEYVEQDQGRSIAKITIGQVQKNLLIYDQMVPFDQLAHQVFNSFYDCILIVIDVQRKSQVEVDLYKKLAMQINGNALVQVVYTKGDLEHDMADDTFTCSAINGYNIDNVFQTLVKNIIIHKEAFIVSQYNVKLRDDEDEDEDEQEADFDQPIEEELKIIEEERQAAVNENSNIRLTERLENIEQRVSGIELLLLKIAKKLEIE